MNTSIPSRIRAAALFPVALVALAASAGCHSTESADTTNYCANTSVEVNTPCQTARECPGVGLPNTNVTCEAGYCQFQCRGEAYDVNGNTADGCEVVDAVRDNHTSGLAINLGDDSCLDSSSDEHMLGIIATDLRQHQNPRIEGYEGDVGAAPDWYVIGANGGFCENDIEFELRVRGTNHLDRYQLYVDTDLNSYECITDPQGYCRIKDGSGSYTDGTWVYIRVAKVNAGDAISCAPEVAEYRVDGHL